MHIFYSPDIKLGDFYLNQEESRHCVKSLRLREGDEIQIIDGEGGFYHAMINIASVKRVEFDILHKSMGLDSRPYYLHVALAPTKSIDRFEWFLEKATEIGIDEITPIISSHSERKVVRLDRMKKIILSAVKQSMKARIPVLNEPVLFDKFIGEKFNGYNKFIAHCDQGQERKSIYKLSPHKKYVLIIGPEGDFSGDEIKDAIGCKFQPLSLGKSRLRTETAGIFACSAINLINIQA